MPREGTVSIEHRAVPPLISKKRPHKPSPQLQIVPRIAHGLEARCTAMILSVQTRGRPQLEASSCLFKEKQKLAVDVRNVADLIASGIALVETEAKGELQVSRLTARQLSIVWAYYSRLKRNNFCTPEKAPLP